MQAQSPFAFASAYGPGPLFYLYLTDPHWGCRDFKLTWTANGRLDADPTSSVTLNGRDARRLELICTPDFKNKIDFYAHAMPARQITMAELNCHTANKGYALAYDNARVWLDYNPNGPDSRHSCLASEMSSGGPSDYYKVDTEVVRLEPADGSPDRFVLIAQGSAAVPAKDPGTLIHTR